MGKNIIIIFDEKIRERFAEEVLDILSKRKSMLYDSLEREIQKRLKDEVIEYIKEEGIDENPFGYFDYESEAEYLIHNTLDDVTRYDISDQLKEETDSTFDDLIYIKLNEEEIDD